MTCPFDSISTCEGIIGDNRRLAVKCRELKTYVDTIMMLEPSSCSEH